MFCRVSLIPAFRMNDIVLHVAQYYDHVWKIKAQSIVLY